MEYATNDTANTLNKIIEANAIICSIECRLLKVKLLIGKNISNIEFQ